MLKRSWHNPAGQAQYNPGCRRLVTGQLDPDSGLSDMPPVEKDMAALTSLGPDRVTADPRCPVRGCHKTDTLVCRTYNAAARAAPSGNALAILLVVTRRSVGPEDPDTLSLVDSALTVHSQLTRDVGAAMSATVVAQRQIWLAQTSLPEGVSRDLTRIPVVPGRVFHPDSQPSLALSPRVFTRVVAAALAPLQAAGLKILPYLDDWLVCSPDRSQASRDTQRVIGHIQNLGFRVNFKKSNLNPTQDISFLGLRLNSVSMYALLSPQRVSKLLSLVSQFSLGRRLELVQRLLGTIVAATAVVPLGLLRARPLQRWLNAFNLHPRRDKRVRLKVTQSLRRALRPWSRKSWLTQGVRLGVIPSCRTVVSTDASLTGWGAVWAGRTVRGSWEPHWQGEHINVLELREVHLALRELLPHIRYRHVLVRTDNTSAVFHVNHQGGTRHQGGAASRLPESCWNGPSPT